MKSFRLAAQSMISDWCRKSARVSVILLVLLSAGGEANSKESRGGRKMTYPNYQATNDSPHMTASETGIKASFANQAAQAVFQSSGPWPLFGAYRVGQATISEFGSQIDSHMLLVVTHKDSKGIYTGRVLKDDPPPKSGIDTEDKGGFVVSTGGYFSVDLKTQCRIPGSPGKYWVVILLGKLASPVLEFEVK